MLLAVAGKQFSYVECILRPVKKVWPPVANARLRKSVSLVRLDQSLTHDDDDKERLVTRASRKLTGHFCSSVVKSIPLSGELLLKASEVTSVTSLMNLLVIECLCVVCFTAHSHIAGQ